MWSQRIDKRTDDIVFTFENIRIHFESDVRHALVKVRRTQWVSVLVNLLSNAVQSVQEQTIGVISIQLKDEGETYLISVADNGPGVSPENYHKLFKPNFTTKSKGTGLGLAICRGIVEQYRVRYFILFRMGGACFNVRIPKQPVIWTKGRHKLSHLPLFILSAEKNDKPFNNISKFPYISRPVFPEFFKGTGRYGSLTSRTGTNLFHEIFS